MTDAEKVVKLKAILDSSSLLPDETLLTLLDFAGRRVIGRAFPFREDVREVPARYADIQVRAAAELYAKLGAEGESSHSENEIARTWESAGISQSLMREIIPEVGRLR